MKPHREKGIFGAQDEASVPRKVSEDDKNLLKIAQSVKPKIIAMGVGGAGCNTMTRLEAIGMAHCVTIAANTDIQHLMRTVSDRKLLLGRELCGGYGAGSDYKIGEEAAKESVEEIASMIDGGDILFLTLGLGGGTGTGGSPTIGEVAKQMGAIVVAVVTLPFEAEGERRRSVAQWGLERLSRYVDTLIVIRNDKILEITGDLPMHQAFLVADEIIARTIKGIAEVAHSPALINVDLADLRAILENGGLALMGVGESDSENRAMRALQEALDNPLFEGDISGATGAIVHISCGPDFSLDEMDEVVETIAGVLDPEANLIWGIGLDESLKGAVRVLLILVGVRSPIYERGIKRKEIKPLISRELSLLRAPKSEKERPTEITKRLDIERI